MKVRSLALRNSWGRLDASAQTYPKTDFIGYTHVRRMLT